MSSSTGSIFILCRIIVQIAGIVLIAGLSGCNRISVDMLFHQQPQRVNYSMIEKIFSGRGYTPGTQIVDATALSGRTKGFISRVINKLPRRTDRIARIADRFGITHLLKRNTKKIIFLTFCTLVIIVSVSYYRSRNEGKRFMTTTRLSIMDKEVQRACRYIEDNFDDPHLGMESVSRALVTGEAFLEALFEKELGLSLDAFINQVRINRIKILLRRTPNTDDATAAHAAGYRNTEQMHAAFTFVSGCVFDEYRRSLAQSSTS